MSKSGKFGPKHNESMLRQTTGPFGLPVYGPLSSTAADIFTYYSARGPQSRANTGSMTIGLLVGTGTALVTTSNPVGWGVGTVTTVGGAYWSGTASGTVFSEGHTYVEFHLGHDKGWHTEIILREFDKNGDLISSESSGCQVRGPNG